MRWNLEPGVTHVVQTEHATPLPPLAVIQNRRASDTNDVNLFVPAGHALLEGGQQVSAQMLAFWQSRLKDAVATGQRLLECASAQEAWEVQLEYA
jgi:Phasin protein